jgi:hypothetical protein
VDRAERGRKLLGGDQDLLEQPLDEGIGQAVV